MDQGHHTIAVPVIAGRSVTACVLPPLVWAQKFPALMDNMSIRAHTQMRFSGFPFVCMCGVCAPTPKRGFKSSSTMGSSQSGDKPDAEPEQGGFKFFVEFCTS